MEQAIYENFTDNFNLPFCPPKIIQDCHSKCGEVYLSKNGNFLFHCDICNKKYENFKYFLHISTDHIEMLDKRTNFSAKSTNSPKPSNFEINYNPKGYLSPTTSVNEVELINNSNQFNYNLSTVYPTTEVHYNQPKIRKYKENRNKSIKHDWEYDTQIEAIINFIRRTPKYLIIGNNFMKNKERIFQPLSEELNIPVEHILKKFKYLRSKLSLEKRVLLEKRSNNDFKYKPTWVWYESFKFWDDDLGTIESNPSPIPISSSTVEDSIVNKETKKIKLIATKSNDVNNLLKSKKSQIIKNNNKLRTILPKISIDELSSTDNKNLYNPTTLNLKKDLNEESDDDHWKKENIEDLNTENYIIP